MSVWVEVLLFLNKCHPNPAQDVHTKRGHKERFNYKSKVSNRDNWDFSAVFLVSFILTFLTDLLDG